MEFTKKDFYFSIITGLITGFSVWKIFNFLDIANFNDISFAWLLLIVPVWWIMGVNLGYFLGKWLSFFNQFGKFAAIGFTNGAVDFGVLNLLIANTDISSGGWYSVFKAISFVSAVIPSYFWNKHWAFAIEDGGSSSTSRRQGFQFAKFMSVAIVSIFINTGTASLVVNFVHPLGGLSVQIWANVGAIAGSAVALIFSFIGFKVAVFKK